MSKKFNDQIKVLGYTSLSKLEKLMSAHFLLQLKSVSDEVTDSPKNIDELNNYVKKNKFTHVFILDEHFHPIDTDLSGCIVPVIGLMGDHYIPWAIQRKKEYIIKNKIQDVFVFTKRFLEPYLGAARFHAVLTGYDKDIFFDYGHERDIDVLIHGSLGEDTSIWVYPIRNWLADILPKIGKAEGIKVEILKHPGYTKNLEEDAARDYSEMLNRAKISTGGSSYWRLPLKKLYEVPACGSILLTDLPLDDTDFFREKILEINPLQIGLKKYERVIRNMIVNALNNYNDYRKKFQPFISDQDRFNRSYQGRALEMRNIISKIE